MNLYDLALIVKDQAEAPQEIEKIITDFQGKVEDQKKWEKRELAYPIRKETTGIYFFWTLKLGADKVSEFKKKLSLNENVLRFLLLVKD